MNPEAPVRPAPRPGPRVGALARLGAIAILLATGAGEAAAQEPPDTLAADTAQVADSLAQEADTVEADTIFYNLPGMRVGVPDGWHTGVWSWSHAEIMASGASTLLELVAEVPGVVTLLGGDFGTPTALAAFGGGAGSVRVERDGFEVVPLAGGVPDLGRLGLLGVERVRLERRGDAVSIELWSFSYDDGRPRSLVEAGTGDLDTNVFRGAFTEPTALGGSLALGMERTDTRGTRAQEPGNRTGAWVRYQLHRGDEAGLAFDLRRAGSETSLPEYAGSVSRTDWAVRGRARLGERMVAEAYTGRSSHGVDDDRDAYALEGGARSQRGVRLSYDGDGPWARAAYRRFGGGALPRSRLDGAVGLTRAGWGGVEAGAERASWRDTATAAVRLRGWTAPVFGLSVFGSHESGTRGARLEPPRMPSPPDTGVADTLPPPRAFGVTDRSTVRLGGAFEWRRVALSAAWLRLRTDSLLPFGLEPDRGQPALGGGTFEGFELWGRLPTFWEGLRLEGSLQQWSRTGPYLPEQIYRGAFVYHAVLKESGTLELWWTLGVRGRDPMAVHLLDDDPDANPGDLQQVPFYQNWYGRIQIRIVSMHLFITWDNLAVRRNLQDYPGRVLPHTRAMYGLRWTLWN